MYGTVENQVNIKMIYEVYNNLRHKNKKDAK